MSGNKNLFFSALLAAFMGGPAARAAEFEVLDRFSVDGYAVLRSSADIPGGVFSVGGSSFVVQYGKVGIGTSNPAAKLEVAGANNVFSRFDFTATRGVLRLFNNSMGLANIADLGIDFTPSTGNPFAGIYSGWQESTLDGFLAFKTSNDGGATLPERIRITSTGSVGIGTAAPEYTVHVLGSNVNGTIAQFSRTGEQSVQMWAGNGTYSGILSTGHLAFLSGGSFTPKMVLQDTGSVGIGTANPAATLDVAGGVKVGTVTATCTSAIAGTLRWYDGHMSVCNGSGWRQLDNQPPPTIASITPASGLIAGGTHITINGTGFNLGLTVLVNGAAATVTGVTALQIAATTPAGSAGAAELKITNQDGQYVAGAFTYNPYPTLTTVSPAAGLQGTAITLTGTGFQTDVSVTIANISATSIVRVSDTQITAAAPASATSGAKDVKVTNPDAGSATLTNGFRYPVSARYWRVRQTGATVSHAPRSGQAEFYLGGNLLNVTSAMLSSSLTPGSPIPYGTANNCSDSGWIWYDGDYLIVDFGSAQSVDQFRVYSTFGGGQRGATWVMEYSDNGSSWTTISTMDYRTTGSYCGWYSFTWAILI